MPWTPTREAALARLTAFVPAAGRRYADLRNFDDGPERRENVSALSPWVRHRVITEGEVVRATLGTHALSAAAKFVQEVSWRTYWKGWLETRPSVWSAYSAQVRADVKSLERDGSLAQRYAEAAEGRTGVAPFDAWARELAETGYLHNHARMWFASIWMFTLELPWALGADLFYRRLLDGDPASNTLSWRWVAGLHTPGKSYLATPANIAKFTNGRFDLHPFALARAPAPIDGPPNPAAGPLPVSDPWPDGPVALLLTEEDLSPLLAEPLARRAVSIAGVLATEDRSALEVGDAPRAFAAGALADALSRASLEADAPSAGVLQFTADALIDWARGAGAEAIVTAYPPVGPVAERLASLSPDLASAGVPLVRRIGAWDRAFWPFAQKGFFALKAEIPALLADLGYPVDTRAAAAFGAKPGPARRPKGAR